MFNIRIIYKEGDIVGDHGIIFIRDLPNRIVNGNTTRYAVFKCPFCLEEFTSVIQNVRSRSKSCGCQQFVRDHGLSGTRIYHSWKDLHGRCYNPNNTAFKNYGGRGIEVCKEWSSFKTFKRIYLGIYASEYEAAKIRDQYIIDNNLTEYILNFN